MGRIGRKISERVGRAGDGDDTMVVGGELVAAALVEPGRGGLVNPLAFGRLQDAGAVSLGAAIRRASPAAGLAGTVWTDWFLR
jgi:hypothetical protein